MRLYMSFSGEHSVSYLSEALLNFLADAKVVEGDPFARHVRDQAEIAEKYVDSDRGKRAIVSSAERMEKRLGPGAEISFRRAGVSGRAIICRNWVRVRLNGTLSREEIDWLKANLRSLGEGELDEFDD